MEKLIILIVLVTGVIALAQLVRVYELTSKLKEEESMKLMIVTII